MRQEPLSELGLYLVHELHLVIGKKDREERLEAEHREQSGAHGDNEGLIRARVQPAVQRSKVLHLLDPARILQDGDIGKQDADAEDLEEAAYHDKTDQGAQLCSFGDSKQTIDGGY